MSSRGFIYVTEDVVEEYGEELDRNFGQGNWRLIGDDYNNLWSPKDFPRLMDITVVGNDGEELGRLTIENNFIVEGDDLGGRWIEVEPIKIIDIKHLPYTLESSAKKGMQKPMYCPVHGCLLVDEKLVGTKIEKDGEMAYTEAMCNEKGVSHKVYIRERRDGDGKISISFD